MQVNPLFRLHSRFRAAVLRHSMALLGGVLLAVSPVVLQAQSVSFAGGQSTVVGGLSFPYGVATDGNGNLFLADGGEIKEILAADGYKTVNILGGNFFGPQGIAVDGSGNVFVGDTYNNAVKEILAASGYTTVKTLSSGFSDPIGVAVDGSGNVFVADSNNNAVKEILAAGGYTTVKKQAPMPLPV